jgi:hypothetical protein
MHGHKTWLRNSDPVEKIFVSPKNSCYEETLRPSGRAVICPGRNEN